MSEVLAFEFAESVLNFFALASTTTPATGRFPVGVTFGCCDACFAFCLFPAVGFCLRATTGETIPI
jgi:hypothetical protein